MARLRQTAGMSSPQPEPVRRGARVNPAVEIPSSVRTAARLLWALVALMVIRTVSTILFLDQESSYVSVALLILLVLGGLLSLCAVHILRGARWARFVAFMFASAGAIAGLLVLFQPSTALFVVLGLLYGAVSVAALVQLFARTSNAFFAAVRKRRRTQRSS